jgi:hypothetical protein
MAFVTDYKKTNLLAFPRVVEEPTPEALFWKKLSVSTIFWDSEKMFNVVTDIVTPSSCFFPQDPVTIKEFGAVQALNFSPVEPCYLAVSASVKVTRFCSV